MTSNHILPSHPRLCSLSVASYDSQGLRWKYSNPPPSHCRMEASLYTASCGRDRALVAKWQYFSSKAIISYYSFVFNSFRGTQGLGWWVRVPCSYSGGPRFRYRPLRSAFLTVLTSLGVHKVWADMLGFLVPTLEAPGSDIGPWDQHSWLF
jgi:hypothetical protein